jgi:adenylate cyclase class 2
MREIEILWECRTPLEAAMKALSHFQLEGEKHTLDVYYFDPLRDNLKPRSSDGKILECFRLRTKAGKHALTYKKDIYENGQWQYSDEWETSVSSFEDAEKIVRMLGLVELVRVDNKKRIYVTPGYEISLESVVGLGNFIEIEAQSVSDETEPATVKAAIRALVADLGIEVGEELNSGKPELLLRQSANRNL